MQPDFGQQGGGQSHPFPIGQGVGDGVRKRQIASPKDPPPKVSFQLRELVLSMSHFHQNWQHKGGNKVIKAVTVSGRPLCQVAVRGQCFRNMVDGGLEVFCAPFFTSLYSFHTFLGNKGEAMIRNTVVPNFGGLGHGKC